MCQFYGVSFPQTERKKKMYRESGENPCPSYSHTGAYGPVTAYFGFLRGKNMRINGKLAATTASLMEIRFGQTKFDGSPKAVNRPAQSFHQFLTLLLPAPKRTLACRPNCLPDLGLISSFLIPPQSVSRICCCHFAMCSLHSPLSWTGQFGCH